MKRAMILMLVVLAAAAGPVQASAETHFRGAPRGIEHHQAFERGGSHRLHGRVPYRVYSYAARCVWQPGYWGYQPYVDAYGQGWYVPQWVPAQYLCY
ncbi:MAG TPA: hypothetical protein VGT00_00795 [Methylomirabilota bacterium]|jgi:hypothetical protein|nr:hypothetical protein [Methylomirabilota bacterium]